MDTMRAMPRPAKAIAACVAELSVYIYVQDVRAEAYGYAGKTQEWRYIEATLRSQR